MHCTLASRMWLLIALSLLPVFLYASFWWSRRRMLELSKDVPTWDDSLPIIGHAHRFIGDNVNLLKQMISISELANRHKGLAKAWLGHKLYYVTSDTLSVNRFSPSYLLPTEHRWKEEHGKYVPVWYAGNRLPDRVSDVTVTESENRNIFGDVSTVTDPEDAETVLNTCLEKDYFYKFGCPWVGEGLINASVPTWKRHHKKLSPAFNQNVLNGFIDIFNKQSSLMAEAMAKEVGKGQFDAYEYTGAATLETICQTAMGTPMGQQNIADPPYLAAIHNILDVLTKRATKIWLHPQFMYNLLGYKKIEDDALKILHHVSNTVVHKKRSDFLRKLKNGTKEDGTETDRPFRAFLDLMLELTARDGSFTETEIREEVDTVIAAGQESTSYGVVLTLLMLGTYQEVQDKVYKEILEIFGDSNRDVTKEDLSNLVYLEAVLKETMRLYPIIPIVVRLIDKDVKLKHYTLPAGSNCGISAWGLHRHERWGPDYDSFRPGRWFDSACVPSHPAAFAAFSYGRRVCIGKNYAFMSMKTMLVHVIKRYRLYSDVTDLELKMDVLLKPVSGHLMKIERR